MLCGWLKRILPAPTPLSPSFNEEDARHSNPLERHDMSQPDYLSLPTAIGVVIADGAGKILSGNIPDHLQVTTPMAQALNKVNAEKGEYRFGCGVRFDLLDPEFLEGMAHIMHKGAVKYGPDNWKKGLTGENSGINHAVKHCMEYLADKPCDYGPREAHLFQVAVNAMFEAYHCRKARLSSQKD